VLTPSSTPDRIPVNIITGFLGSGKTSAVLNLLKQKPPEEHWAILVNEFGEIGVDRSLMQGHAVTHDRVAILEVPGGCMCCAAGLPMQMALSQLLFFGKPDRLLIEPTGLGHPVEVLQTLFSEAYIEILEVQSTLTLIDARSAASERHANHASFVQQLRIADLILANKKDLYSNHELALIDNLVQQHCDREIPVYPTEQGKIDLALITQPTTWIPTIGKPHHAEPNYILAADRILPDSGYIGAINSTDGFQSVGWRFSAAKPFDYSKVFHFLKELQVDRAKAVFITEKGIYGYNLAGSTLSEIEIDDCAESRIEIIAEHIEAEWETALLSCLLPD
jgi:G3E family GTPase